MFKSARLKIERAEHHIGELERRFEEFKARKPHRFSVKHNEVTGQPIVQVRFVEKLPDAFSVVIGDAVHNLRCALDHLLWELVGWDGGTQDKNLQFPFSKTKVDFEGACKGIQTPSDWIKTTLAGLECCPSGKGASLYIIYLLDNADKHRTITPVLRATSHPPFRIVNAAGNIVATLQGNILVGIGDTGNVSITNIPPGCHIELEDDASCPPSIFLQEAGLFEDAFDCLNMFARSVRLTIEIVESEVAKHPKA